MELRHFTVKMENGVVIDVATDDIPIEDYEDYLFDCKQDYKQNPCMKTYLRLLIAESEWDDVNGRTDEAVERLLQGLDPDNLEALFGNEDDTCPDPSHKIINAAECLTEFLLKQGKIEEASEWVEDVYEMSLDRFSETDQLAYALALRGNCFQATGKRDAAKVMYEESLNEIDDRISDLTDLRESLRRNLDELDG